VLSDHDSSATPQTVQIASSVHPYIGDALRYLPVTQKGKQWIAKLYAHVFSEEHRGAFGAY